MAELFKPEIKDIGGTNVTAYSPPTTDYSGIFSSIARTMDSFESKKAAAPKLSEAEEKNLVLEPYLSKVQKILSSDDIPEIKKYAMVNGIKTEVARMYPSYNDVFEKATTTITNVFDPDGDPIQKEYEAVAKWGETENGTFSRAEAFNLAIDKEGSFDEGLYQSKIRELYYKDIQDKNSLAVQKRRNEMNTEQSKELFRTDFAPNILKDISTSIETFSQGTAAKTLLTGLREGPFVPGSQEATSALLMADQVGLLKKRWEAEITRRKVEGGYALNDPAFNTEALLVEITNLETALRTGGESVSKALSSMNEQTSIAFISNMPSALRATYELNKSTPQAVANTLSVAMMSLPENKVSMENYAKNFRTPTYDFNLPMVGTGQTSSLPNLPVGADQSISSIQASFPEFNSQMVPEVVSMSQGSKKNLLTRTTTAIENAVIKDMDQAMVQAKELSASYLTLGLRLSGDAETGVTPLEQTKVFFGPKAMNLATEIQKKSPTEGEALYPQINKAIQTETLRHTAFLGTMLTRNFPNNPLVIRVNEKGMVELVIDPQAKKEDPVFRRLTEIGFESDEEILNNLQTSMGINPSFFKTLKNSVESLNIYLMAANRLPDSLKNSPDFAGIFIRDQLSTLPRYGGAGITAPVAP